MRFSALAAITAILPFIGLSVAEDCDFQPVSSDGIDLMSDALCVVNDDKGIWTFSMFVTLTNIPSLSLDNPNAGNSGSKGFVLYDADCNIKGFYARPSCGIPWYSKNPEMPYQLKVDVVDLGLGSPYFRFQYGAGQYSTSENSCGCTNIEGVYGGEKNCKCPFPLNGDGRRI